MVLTRCLTKCWSFLGRARAASQSQHYQSSETLARSAEALHPLQMPFRLAAMPTPVLPKHKSLRQQPAATSCRALPTPAVAAAKAVVLPQPASQPGKRRRVEAEARVTVTGSVHGLTDTVSLRPLVLLLLASFRWIGYLHALSRQPWAAGALLSPQCCMPHVHAIGALAGSCAGAQRCT